MIKHAYQQFIYNKPLQKLSMNFNFPFNFLLLFASFGKLEESKQFNEKLQRLDFKIKIASCKAIALMKGREEQHLGLSFPNKVVFFPLLSFFFPSFSNSLSLLRFTTASLVEK